MNKIISIDEESHMITVEAGLKAIDLESYLKKHNGSKLTLRHFPQSYEFTQIGAMVVTKSGGHFATINTRINHFVVNARLAF